MKLRKFVFVMLLYCLLPIAAAAAADSDIIQMGVTRFASKAENVSSLQAEIITDIFTRVLSNSKSIALIERERLDMIGKEHKLNMSGLVDMSMAVEVGRLAGCRYMLLGSVTGLDEKVSGGGFSIIAVGNRLAEATIDLRIVDVATSEIILSFMEKGSSSQQTVGINYKGAKWAEADLSDIKARAIADAAVRLGHRIRVELAGDYSQILSIAGKSVTVNIGNSSGVQNGNLFLVYADGAEVYDLDGSSLGREKHPIAVLKVINASGEFSACEVAADGGKAELIRRGDKIEPIGSKESQELAKQKRFPEQRPGLGAYDETAEQLLGNKTDDTQPLPAQAAEKSATPPAPVLSGKPFENISTDPQKVIDTYPLDPGEKNMLRIAHLNARKLRNQKAYDAYAEMANTNSGDYLAAFQAGEWALKLKKKDEAKIWYGKALAINPYYKPASDAITKNKLGDIPVPAARQETVIPNDTGLVNEKPPEPYIKPAVPESLESPKTSESPVAPVPFTPLVPERRITGIEDVPWSSNVPNIDKTDKDIYRTIEPHPEGVRIQAKKDHYVWWSWRVGRTADRTVNNWQFRGTLERMNDGGGGVLFGRVKQGMFIAAFIYGGKLALIEYSKNSDFTELIKEVNLNPEHQKQGPFVITLSVRRDTKTIRCSVGDTEYINMNLTGIVDSLPPVEEYGLFCAARYTGRRVSLNVSRETSIVVFKKIEARCSKI